ncbi:MAG: DUF2191 domain-containing protein [Deltaproteobacteria bacterium]|nr:DUF2191 domain-containing protein [Deltaproteobacteria bacterium]
MRTTIDIDEDLSSKLRRIASKRGASFKEVINEAIRRGLAAQERAPRRRTPFRVEPFRSAFRPGVDPLRLNALVDELEIQDRLGAR